MRGEQAASPPDARTALISAIGCAPCAFTQSSEASATKAAPSFIVQAFAAVSIPSGTFVTCGALASSRSLILGRMASSLVLPKRGTMYGARQPSFSTRLARLWLRRAASSASSLEIPAFFAARSAPRSIASSLNSPGRNCAAVNSGSLFRLRSSHS